MAAILISNVKRGIRVYSSEGREENHPLSFSRFDTHPQTRLGTFKTQMAACKDRCEQSSEGGISQSKKRKKAILPVHEKSLRGSLTVVVKLRSMLQWFCYKWLWWVLGLILWKIMSPSPWTNDSQLKKIKIVQKEKRLGLYVIRQLVWRQTPKLWITVYGN